jgi:hypothetical protein
LGGEPENVVENKLRYLVWAASAAQTKYRIYTRFDSSNPVNWGL